MLGRTEEQGGQCYKFKAHQGESLNTGNGRRTQGTITKAHVSSQETLDFILRVQRGHWKIESRKWYDLIYSVEGRVWLFYGEGEVGGGGRDSCQNAAAVSR